VASVYFADTSFYIALLKPTDSYHSRVRVWRDYLAQTRATLLTTEAVLWELLNSFASHTTRRQAAAAYNGIHRDRRTDVIGFDPALCAEAMQLYGGRPDKDWGIVDCLSFELMRQRNITDALTTDRHFEQAGFSALLLHDPPT
jgi:hypothetical protein